MTEDDDMSDVELNSKEAREIFNSLNKKGGRRMTKVVHHKKEPYDIYIGRPSEWGNPFRLGWDGTREEIIKKYSDWLLNQPELMEKLPTLRGKILGCWCKPLLCHGDVLARLANNSINKKIEGVE